MTLALARPASAATLTWTNTAGGIWASATNWSPNAIPGSGDTAVVNASGTYAVSVDGSRSVGTVVMANPTATLRLVGHPSVGPASLTVANGLINEGTIELTTSNVNYSASLTVTSGTLTNATGGLIRIAQGAGASARTLNANLANQGTVEVAHDLTYSGNFINDGTVNLAAGKTLTVQGTTTWTHRNGGITGSGTLSLANGSTFVLEEDFTPGTFTLNAPNLTVNGPARFLGPTSGEFVIRQWTINAEVVVSGDLRIEGTVNFNSALAVAAGKTLRLVGHPSVGPASLTVANGLINEGTIELTTSNVNYSASLTVTSGTLTNATGGLIRIAQGAGASARTLNANLANQGTVEVAHDLTYSGNFINDGTVNLAAGKTLTVQGTTTWTHRNGGITGSGTLSLANGSTFVLEEDFTPGTFTLNAPNLTVNGPARFLGPTSGEFVIRQWTINAEVVVSGDLRIEGTVNFNSALAVAAGKTLRLVGHPSVGPASLTVANGLINEGTIELTTSNVNYSASLTVTSGTLTNATGGLIRIAQGAGASARTLNANLANQGTVEVAHDLTYSGNFINDGTVNLAAGKTLTVQGTTTWTHRNGGITGSGTLSLANGSTFVLEEDFTPGTFTLNAPNLTVNGPARFLGPTSGEFVIRQWTINAEVVVSGDLRIEGTVNFNSALAVAAGKTLRLVGHPSVGPASLTLTNGLINEGTIELTTSNVNYSASLTVTSGTLTNATGGLIRIAQGAGASARTLNANLANQGTVEVAHDLTYSGNFINDGTVNLAAGKTLTVQGTTTWTHRNGGITGSGTLSLANGSTFVLEEDFTPGTFTLNAPNLTVNGPARFLGPTSGEFVIRQWTINAEVVVSGDLRIEGTVNFNSALAVAAGKTLRLVGHPSVGPASLTVANGLINEGTIELTTSNVNYSASLTVTSGTLTNATGGLIRIAQGAGASARTLNANLANQGTVEVAHDLTYSGNFINDGTVNLAAGKTLTVQGTTTWTHRNGGITGSGTLSLANGSTFVLEEDFTPGTFTLNAPNLTVNGPARFLGPTSGEFVIRQWTINAEVVVSGDLRIEGTVNFNSALAVAAGKTLRLVGHPSVGPASLTVANGLINEGTIELTTSNVNYSASLTVTSGTLTNATGGLIRIAQGAGASARTLNANLANQGTLLVLAGTTLSMNGNLLNTSSGVLGGGGTFNFASAIVTNDGMVAPGVSPGILTVSGNLPWNPVALFDVEMDGFTAGTNYDRLVLSSPVSFNGIIRAGLINGFFPKKDDAFTVLTYPSRTGSFTTLDNPLPDRIAWAVQYGATSAQLVVLNTAPTLAAITNQTVNEQTQLSVTASATDQDLPAQTMTYSLDTAPTGMTINPASGQISWTPTEAQGPGVFDVTVRVTDNGTPALGHTNSFSVTVNEVNVAPQLVLPGAQAVNEQAELVFTINGTDADLPANALTYALVSAPPSATFNPTTREFRWTPTEAQGPGNFTATFRVTDNNPDAVNTQQLSTTNSVSITVAEVNLRPVLAVIGNQTVNEGTLFATNATATDADLPANPLTYALVAPPAGMTINPASGAISWTPTEAQGPVTNTITVVVTDTNPPAANAKQLSATNTFQITVNEANIAPVLPVQTNRTINELTLLTVTNTATDSDLPANGLSYALTAFPPGATISTNGIITWTPTEAQGNTTNTFTTVVTDTNLAAVSAQNLTATNTFVVIVNELNVAPVLPGQISRTINELTLLTVTNTATDSDLPANGLGYALTVFPPGATISSSGVITWTPTEAQGNTTNTFTTVVTDTNLAAVSAQNLTATNTFVVIVNEINVAPVLPGQISRTINELTLLTVTNTATDSDLPANGLGYALLVAPGGAAISTAGIITWTPTEAQGNTTNTFTTVVTDTNLAAVNAQNLSATNIFVVIVNEMNASPILSLPISQAINEQVFYTNNATATDADAPANPLVFALVSGPAGLTVSSVGAITWTPTEAQGPSVYPVQIRVTDTNPLAVNATSLSVTSSFTLTVNEVNLAPTLIPPANRVIHAGTTLSVGASATDPDLPVNTFTYGKVTGPAGVTVNAAGLVTWNTSDADANSTNTITLKVTDNGSPSLSHTNNFVVTIRARPVFTLLDFAGGSATAEWTAISGASYRLQYRTNIGDATWADLAGDVVAGGSTATKTDTTPGTNATRFYRVFVLP